MVGENASILYKDRKSDIDFENLYVFRNVKKMLVLQNKPEKVKLLTKTNLLTLENPEKEEIGTGRHLSKMGWAVTKSLGDNPTDGRTRMKTTDGHKQEFAGSKEIIWTGLREGGDRQITKIFK